MKCNFILSSLFIALVPFISNGQISAKLIQYPDVSQDKICFTFGDDIWLVDKTGGDAIKLVSPMGRETNPKFSPDGKRIAFEANYDGNNDLYSIPILGGVPKRITGHGMTESIQDWSADGQHIYYASSMHSGKQRWSEFYKVDVDGGLPEKLPVALGAFADISEDGSQIAFTDKSRVFRTWKRYRGGTAPDIYVMNTSTYETKNITNNAANDEKPMWHGDRIYYLSDNGPSLRNNIWVHDTNTGVNTQLTFFKDFDVHYPSKGPSDIVFEAGGEIHLMNLQNNEVKTVEINAVGDFTRIKPELKNTGANITTYNIAPDGNRAVITARGDVYSLPKKEGVVKNLTHTSGVAERFAAWSPDGKYIAYFSDTSGEYELYTKNLKTGEEIQRSALGPGYRYNIYWSPDSKSVVFIDNTMTFYVLDLATKKAEKIDQGLSLFEGGLRNFSASWSPDSRWISYTKEVDTGNRAVFIYDTHLSKHHKITSGFYNDNQVIFGRDGDHLFLTTNRSFSPSYSDFDNTWAYVNATQIAAIPLRKDVKSPLAVKNDAVESDEKDEDDEKDGDKEKDKNEEDEEKDSEEDVVDPVEIEFEGIERRMVVLPITLGNGGSIAAISGKLLYLKAPNTGSDEEDSVLKYYDLEERKEKQIVSGITGFKVDANGQKIIARASDGFAIIDIAEDQKMEHTLATSDMEAVINPREEWHQIFMDVWRLERDYFYDANMHGLDWDAVKEKYLPLVEQARSRYDLNFIIGEVIGELNASHTYRGGGDSDAPKRKNVGYLGVDWEQVNGQFRIKRIVKGADWDTEVRSPLEEPGVDINEGDYVLAVNGRPLNMYTDPWIAFTGMADKTVELTVSSSPTETDSRKILVKPMRSETRLRNLEWIERNRQMVDKLSNGKIGYIYVPSTGRDGQHELVRMFYGQWNKEGLIIDERFNNGGQIPDRFVELLNRKPLAYFDVRDGKNWQWPPVAHFGPKAMLINGWSGSGGDAFPDYFKKSDLGPLIGTRTWGGVIGISGAPSLIDGGRVTVPTFRMYDPEGKWFAEGHGVEPDIEVKENHEQLAKGKDPQIEKAVEYILEELEKRGPIHPPIPEMEDRSNR